MESSFGNFQEPESGKEKNASSGLPDPKPNKLFRFSKGALKFFGALSVIVALVIIVALYLEWRQVRKIDQLARSIKSYQEEVYQKQMADTYGGKTPQETLDLFISAVEKGDYELASKYFVETERASWLKALLNLDKDKQKLDNFLSLVRKSRKSNGEYSWDKQEFYFDDPIAVNFVLYPNGIWKLTEI